MGGRRVARPSACGTSPTNYVAGLMKAGTLAGNQLGAVTVSTTVTDAYDKVLVPMGQKLDENNVPRDDRRWVIVTPAFYAKLLLDGRFIKANGSGSNALQRSRRSGGRLPDLHVQQLRRWRDHEQDHPGRHEPRHHVRLADPTRSGVPPRSGSPTRSGACTSTGPKVVRGAAGLGGRHGLLMSERRFVRRSVRG